MGQIQLTSAATTYDRKQPIRDYLTKRGGFSLIYHSIKLMELFSS